MKLSELKNKLNNKNLKNKRDIRKEYKQDLQNDSNRNGNLDSLKIIGITGSYGKTTTAIIVHEYLKSLGYKSVLYSSSKVESPASYIKDNEAFEVAVRTEDALLSIIEEAEAYKAEYLVLEVNESILEKGFLKDVPFAVRVLTNLNPTHCPEHYTKEEYVALKKSFFENINDNCKCVIGLQNYDKELFEELLKLNLYPKYTFTSKHIAGVKGVETSKMTCLLHELYSTLDGLEMEVLINDVSYNFKTTVMMAYNALNFVCAMTVLLALDLFEVEKFNKCINSLKIPGRAEVFKANDRLIVVDAQLSRMLESLYKFKEEGLVNKIKVVLGSIGTGFKTWEEKFKSNKFLSGRQYARRYAMELLKKYADYAYLTEQDNASESVLDICNELQSYLNNEIPSLIVINRSDAIRKAIKESEEGDVIFISGRGNRKISCNTATTMKLLKDTEIVEKVLEELNWK